MCCSKCMIKDSRHEYDVKQLQRRIDMLVGFITINGLKDRLDSVYEAERDDNKSE